MRTRRAVAAVAAAALAAAGLATASPASAATAAATVTISPSTITAGVVSSLTLTVTGGTDANASRVAVAVPSGYDAAVSVTSSNVPSTWDTPSFDSVARQVVFSAKDNTTDLANNQVLSAVISVKATDTSASTSWAVSAFKNKNAGGSGNSTTTGVNPSVTVQGGTQTITFGALSNRTYGDAPFTVSATGGASGSPVTFTASGPCTATGTNGTTITLTGAGSCTVTANQAAGNGYTAAAPVSRSFTIAKAAQSITLGSIDSQTYGDPALTLAPTGGGSGNPVVLTATGTCSVDGFELSLDGAGECTVKANQAGNANYLAADEVSRTFTINKAAAVLSLGDLTFTYDGEAHGATVTTDPEGLTDVTVTYDGEATEPTDAGTYEVVATLTNANYDGSITGDLVIDPKPITGSFTIVDGGRVYDGTTDIDVDTRSLDGVVDGDTVTLDGGTATLDSKNAGTRTATLSGAELGGEDKGNYELIAVDNATAEITPLEVTGTILAGDKTYDGTTAATVTEWDIEGEISGDDLSLDVGDADFDDANVGVRKATAAIALSGADKDNYTLSSDTASDDATISQRELVGAFTIDNKVYDGGTSATVKAATLDDAIAGDDVELVVSDAAFDDKAVGTDKKVTVTLSLGGAAAGNYDLTNAGTAYGSADITPKPVTASITADNKVWDGTTAATIHPSLSGALANDDVSLTGGTGSFNNADVGAGKTVTATGFTLSGADKDNYSLAAGPWTTTASIGAAYSAKGFYQPVDMTPAGAAALTYNSVKGGSTVPIKFEFFSTVGDKAEQTDTSIFGTGAFKVSTVTCRTSNVLVDAIEVTTSGSTSLRYDATGGQFVQNWKTPTTANTCYAVSVTAKDGSTIGPAYFQVTK